MVPARRPDLANELIPELVTRAPLVGTNAGPWPGLTIYRFTSPVRWMSGRPEQATLHRYLGADYEIRSFGGIMTAFSGQVVTTSDSITWQSVVGGKQRAPSSDKSPGRQVGWSS